MPRDDFSLDVKRILAARVATRCSNPSCRAPTAGPNLDDSRAVNLGVAAHITAAAAGGPRYDGEITARERASTDNAIWLCQNCARLIDSDAGRYPVDLLRGWKVSAEKAALASLGRAAPADGPDRSALVAMYPRIEQLIAIYSLMCWRQPAQPAPSITEDSEWGGQEFTLECPDIQWGTGGITPPGELFRCFARTVERQDMHDGKMYNMYNVTPNEDFWYHFSWETLFGYEVNVTISPVPSEIYALRDAILEKHREARAEIGPGGEGFGHVPLYAVRVSGLTHAGEVTFIAAGGYFIWLANGGIDVVREWVVYLDEPEPIRLGSINKMIRLILQTFDFADPDLERAVPRLHSFLLSSGASQATALLQGLHAGSGLAELARYVEG